MHVWRDDDKMSRLIELLSSEESFEGSNKMYTEVGPIKIQIRNHKDNPHKNILKKTFQKLSIWKQFPLLLPFYFMGKE